MRRLFRAGVLFSAPVLLLLLLSTGAKAWRDIVREAEQSVFQVQKSAVTSQAATMSAQLSILAATCRHLASHADNLRAALWSVPDAIGNADEIRVLQLDSSGRVLLDSSPSGARAYPLAKPGVSWLELEGQFQFRSVEDTRDNGQVWLLRPAQDFSKYLEAPWSWVVGPDGRILAHADSTQIGTFPFRDRVTDPRLSAMLQAMADGQTGYRSYDWIGDDGTVEHRMASFTSVPGHIPGMSIGTSTNHTAALAGVVRARMVLGTTVLLLLLLTVAAGFGWWWLQRQIALRERRMNDEREAMMRATAHGERLALLGTLTAGVAHDLRGPISAAQLLSDLMQEADADELSELSREMQEAIETLTHMVDELTQFSRSSREARTIPTDALAFAERMVRARLPSTVQVHFFCNTHQQLAIEQHRFAQSIYNLAVNAWQAGAAAIQVSATAALVDKQPCFVLNVDDDGPGVPEPLREQLFHPFYTTKKAEEGTGLGLHMVRASIEKAGGTIQITDGPLGGARFQIVIPCAQTESVPEAHAPPVMLEGRQTHHARGPEHRPGQDVDKAPCSRSSSAAPIPLQHPSQTVA